MHLKRSRKPLYSLSCALLAIISNVTSVSTFHCKTLCISHRILIISCSNLVQNVLYYYITKKTCSLDQRLKNCCRDGMRRKTSAQVIRTPLLQHCETDFAFVTLYTFCLFIYLYKLGTLEVSMHKTLSEPTQAMRKCCTVRR